MVNVSKFVKDHFPLCVCTLGIAIIGYLGYHAVRWIINKCQSIDKIDHVGQKNINNQPSSNSPKFLTNRVDSLEVSQDKITMGQGEYVVFHKLPSGEKKELSPETFEQVYKVLIHYSPAALMNSGSEKANEECANRYERIKSEINKIDPSLKVIFVPRTLIELILIRKCIKEDLKNNEICPFLNRQEHHYIHHPENLRFYQTEDPQRRKENLEEIQALKDKRKCWHLCYFDDVGDNQHADLKKIAFRLNKAIVKTLSPSNEGFSYQEFSVYAEKEIDFLKMHYHKDSKEMERLYAINKDKSNGCRVPGPTMNFGYELTRDKPMGIRNEIDAQIIRDAVKLDCSKIAQQSFILYRGANFEKDACFCWDDKDKPYSLSFGSSLFAGCLFDGGATAFHYMRNGRNAYAIPVPFDQLNDSPFFIPPANTCAQLFADGEIFHARTKAWANFDMNKIGGMNNNTNGYKREHLKSNLSQAELIDKFQKYKKQSIQLKE